MRTLQSLQPLDYNSEMKLALECLKNGNKSHATFHYRRAAKPLESKAQNINDTVEKKRILNESYIIMEKVRLLEND